MKNLRFDGHGINAPDGSRLATFTESAKPLARTGLGRVLAGAPEALSALKTIIEWNQSNGRPIPEEISSKAADAIWYSEGGAVLEAMKKMQSQT